MISISNLAQVNSIHPECQLHLEIREEEARCSERLRAQPEPHKGRRGLGAGAGGGEPDTQRAHASPAKLEP